MGLLQKLATPCPLCLNTLKHKLVSGADQRQYYLCSQCALIFVDPTHLLSPQEERAHYTTHENHINNAGYVSFLNQVLQPMLPYLNSGMCGLDYGCGPGSTLSKLFKQHDISCEDYDPFFENISLKSSYDFITATECLEHFHKPDKEIARISQLVKSSGLLGIMTETWTTLEAFGTWYYTKDPTHVCFYHANTFDYICTQYGWMPLWQDAKRVYIFNRITQSPE